MGKKDKIQKRKKKAEEEKPEETIDIEFALFEPDESDFHGIRPYFVKAWDFSKKTILDSSELADVVSGQGNIGNMIKTDESEQNCFGVLSIINLKQYEKTGLAKSVPALVAFLKKKCKKINSSLMPKLKDVLSLEKQVGLLLNERIVTLPVELIPLLHDNLKEDIVWSQTTPECPEDERPFYFFDHLIGLAKMFKHGNEQVYAKYEEEVYVKHSDFHFPFPVKDNEYRVFYCLDFKILSTLIADIHRAALVEAASSPARENKENTTTSSNTSMQTPSKKGKKRSRDESDSEKDENGPNALQKKKRTTD